MHIKTLQISNCKSYKTPETIFFDEQFTIFVGPNGGGKSNTLDILTVALRRFLMPVFVVNEGEEHGRLIKDIQRLDTFSDINRFLEAFTGQEGQEVKIDVTIVVGTSDVKNIELVNAYKQNWDNVRAKYRNSPYSSFSFVDTWMQNPVKAGDEFTFSIVNGNFTNQDNQTQNVFRNYLESINYFLSLCRFSGHKV